MDSVKLSTLQKLYLDYEQMDRVKRSLLRRANKPDELFEVPVFYELFRKHAFVIGKDRLARLVFCLGYLVHTETGPNLGTALAQKDSQGKTLVNERRVIQVARIQDDEKAMVQLRRLLKQAARSQEKDSDVKRLTVDWQRCGPQLWFWNKKSKKQFLEDYFTGTVNSKEKDNE